MYQSMEKNSELARRERRLLTVGISISDGRTRKNTAIEPTTSLAEIETTRLKSAATLYLYRSWTKKRLLVELASYIGEFWHELFDRLN
jgi:Mg-chelatase subunit ChlD